MILAQHGMLAKVENFSHEYLDVLARAAGQGYAQPSYACKVLQNQLIYNLRTATIWPLLDYLYIYADDSGAIDMARINFRYPSRAVSGTGGTVTHVSKQGIHNNGSGQLNHIGMDYGTDKIAMNADNNCSFFVWLTEAGGAISAIEALTSVTGANTFAHTIRLRTNPRVDYLLNTTSASPQTLVAGLPSDNDFYQIEMVSIAASNHRREWVNGVNIQDDSGVSAGTLPDDNSPNTLDITSSRAVGLIGGGAAMDGLNTDLYDIFNTYMTALAAL